MPARVRSKNIPVAPRRKRLLHAFYLAQPFLQFVALMAVLFTLGRCSPLAPSTDKSVLKNSSNGVTATHSEHGVNVAIEEDSMKDLSRSDDLSVMSQTNFTNRVLANSIEAERGADMNGVRNLFRIRDQQRGQQRSVRVLVSHMDESQRLAFFKGDAVSLDLASKLGPVMKPDVRKEFFARIDAASRNNDLTAKAYLVLSNDDMMAPDAVESIPVATKFQLGVTASNDKAWVRLQRTARELDEQQQKLIESNISKRGAYLALVLE